MLVCQVWPFRLITAHKENGVGGQHYHTFGCAHSVDLKVRPIAVKITSTTTLQKHVRSLSFFLMRMLTVTSREVIVSTEENLPYSFFLL